MRLELSSACIRSFAAADAVAVQRYAGNIWINLRDIFPHPYSLEHLRRAVRKQSRVGAHPRKAGYICEGRLTASVFKDSKVQNSFMYARTL